MIPFTLATVRTPAGPQAAIGLGSRFQILADMLPDFPSPTCKSLLAAWDATLPLLAQAAGRLAGDPSLGAADVELLTPVLYPDKLLAVGANYSGHLEEMGLAVCKWDVMPFFVRPPASTLVGPRPNCPHSAIDEAIRLGMRARRRSQTALASCDAG